MSTYAKGLGSALSIIFRYLLCFSFCNNESIFDKQSRELFKRAAELLFLAFSHSAFYLVKLGSQFATLHFSRTHFKLSQINVKRLNTRRDLVPGLFTSLSRATWIGFELLVDSFFTDCRKRRENDIFAKFAGCSLRTVAPAGWAAQSHSHTLGHAAELEFVLVY